MTKWCDLHKFQQESESLKSILGGDYLHGMKKNVSFFSAVSEAREWSIININ